MSLFIVVLEEGSDAQVVTSKLKQGDIPYYSLSNSVFIVRYSGISAELKTELDVKGKLEGGVSGAVFSLDGGYSGFASMALWEWLNKHSA